MCVFPLCLWVALAQAACICLVLGCSSSGRTQTLAFFEVPWLYITAFPLGCVMHLSVSCITCDVAACGTGFLALKSPYHSPGLVHCQAAHTDPISLWCCCSHARLQLAHLRIIPGVSCQLCGGRVKAVWVCILILHFLFFRSLEFCYAVWEGEKKPIQKPQEILILLQQYTMLLNCSQSWHIQLRLCQTLLIKGLVFIC